MIKQDQKTRKLDLRSSLWFSQPGVLYFIEAGAECGDCRSIKIGVTLRERLLKRLRAIQSANHTKIRLLALIEFATMSEAETKEKELHTRFAEYARLPGRTVGYEWFRATDQVMAAVHGEGTPPADMVNGPDCLGDALKLFG